MKSDTKDILRFFKRLVEIVKPDLRHYYKVVRKARVIQSYDSNGRYYADVQPLRNDDSVDEKEPVIKQIEIPIIWGGPDRGIVCPPAAGTYCDLEYYDGDPDYPRISNFRWHGNGAPEIEVGGFILQQMMGSFFKIDKDGNISVEVPGTITVKSGGSMRFEAPRIDWN